MDATRRGRIEREERELGSLAVVIILVAVVPFPGPLRCDENGTAVCVKL